MKLADVVGALRRRWYVLLAGILIAAGGATYVWMTVSPEYERTASQLLLPGKATIPEDANPYLFVGGLYQVADILVRAIGPDDVAAATAEHPDATVAVTRDTAAGAVMIVTVTASSEDAAATVLENVTALTASRLGELQDEKSIPGDERIELVPLTNATQSVVIQKTRMLTAAAVGIGGLALGAVAAVLADTFLRSRRRARTLRDPQDSGPADELRDGDEGSEEPGSAEVEAPDADAPDPDAIEAAEHPASAEPDDERVRETVAPSAIRGGRSAGRARPRRRGSWQDPGEDRMDAFEIEREVG